MHMKKNIRKMLATTLFAGSCITLKPISETSAKVWTGVGSVVAGGAAGVGTYIYLKDQQTNQVVKIGLPALAALGAGALTGYVLYQWLFSMTPPGRFASASRLVNIVAHDSLIRNDFSTRAELYSHTTSRFGGSWPLVLARDRYQDLRIDLESAQSLLSLVRSEATGNPQYRELCRKASELQQQITELSAILEPRVNALTEHDQYTFQVNLHERHLEAERQRSHERQLQSNNLTHDSVERNKDRYHEKNLVTTNHRHDSQERHLDRVHASTEKAFDRGHERNLQNNLFNHEDRRDARMQNRINHLVGR